MARTATFRQWNSHSNFTRDMSIVTKMTTLGTPDTKKDILGYYISLKQSSENTEYDNTSLSQPSRFTLDFLYRTRTDGDFIPIANIGDVVNENISSRKSINQKVVFANPIKGLYQIQLAIKIPLAVGEFSINDFGILYRVVRDTSTETHDED